MAAKVERFPGGNERTRRPGKRGTSETERHLKLWPTLRSQTSQKHERKLKNKQITYNCAVGNQLRREF